MSNKDKKEELEVVKVNTIQATCIMWDSLLTVTEWQNGEGFDLSISSKNGGVQSMCITYAEFYLLKKIIKKLDNL